MADYQNPFITCRADPYILRAPDDQFYFTASYPAVGSAENGYDRIILRTAKTVAELASAEEHTVWQAHSDGAMARHIWAPELHLIGGKWYIFFAAADKEDIWHIRPYVLRCCGEDPVRDQWEEMGMMRACADDPISFTNFSLDMTYFSHRGEHFLIWAQILNDSSLFMARIDPEKPWQLKEKPILLSKPEYDWEKVVHRVNEGPSVLKTDKKVYIFFSASGTGAEYCIGRLSADADADLMNPESWHKEKEPVLSTSDLEGEAGPGHNSFVTDENGDLLLIYHARPASHLQGQCGTYCKESLYDPCRHTRIKKVSFDENDVPILK
ncbi:MAG: family 43 glycosylhydrolase [Acutalibacteraceae bacterium]